MQVSDACGIIFNPLFVKKEQIWGNGTKTVQNHPMQHTHKSMFNETTI